MAQDVFKDEPTQQVDTRHGFTAETDELRNLIITLRQRIDIELDPASDLYVEMRNFLERIQRFLVKL
jgi:hypothetical protein